MKNYIITILSVLVLLCNANAQCLSGTYTVGGNNPDYSNFSSAVAALVVNGVCGPVVFSVRDSVYNETFSIPAIAGTSTINTVTFQAAYGLLGQVKIQSTASSASTNDYVVQLQGATNIHFRHITFTRIGPGSYRSVLRFKQSATDVGFDYCNFLGVSQLLSSTSNKLVVSSDSFQCNKLWFKNCSFAFADNAIYLSCYQYLPSYQLGKDVIIDSCTFNNMGSNVLAIHYFTQVSIKNNDFSMPAIYDCISLSSCKEDVKISCNKFNSGNGYKLSLYLCGSQAGLPIIVDNNFMGNSTSGGIILDSDTNVIIAHNTINHLGAGSNAWCVYSRYSRNIQVLNNCLYGSKQIGSESTTLFTSDYNSFGAKSWSFKNGQTEVDHLNWLLYTGNDLHSRFSTPNFYSNTDLHIFSTPALNGTALPLNYIATDIDMEQRSTAPDIGADEFTPANNNIRAISIASPTFPVCPGIQPLNLMVENYGGNVLDSFKIGWIINGQLQNSFIWHGSLAPGDTANIMFGSYNFAFDSMYSITVFTSLPNNNADAQPQNDTLKVVNGRMRMTGTYTIGGIAPAFDSIKAAAYALTLRGVCGPVTLNIRDGFYYESVEFNLIDGLSATNTITLQSETADSNSVFWLSSGHYALQLTNISYFTIRNLTFSNENVMPNYDISSPIPLVVLGIRCNNITIENNVLSSKTSDYFQIPSADYALIAVNASTTPNSAITIRNNRLIRGQYGVLVNQSSAQYCKNIYIEGNKFIDQNMFGIYARRIDSSLISKNIFSSTRDTLQLQGFDLSAVFVENMTRSQILANRINWTYGGGMEIIGATTVNPDSNLIANNFISTRRKALRLRNCSGLLFYHNSVNVRDSSANSHILEMSGASNSNIRFFNNILSNSAGGHIFHTSPNNVIFNNNCFYTTGPFSTSYPTFGAWQSAGNDSRSQNTNPVYISAIDLHVLSNPVLVGIADTNINILRDIDGDLRKKQNAYPGADEIQQTGIDVMLDWQGASNSVCHAMPYINIGMTNLSNADTLHCLTVKTYVNNSLVYSGYWTGSLAPNQTINNVYAGTAYFYYGINYSVKVIASLPNYTNDINAVNDTAQLNNFSHAMGGTYTIGGLYPDFRNITDAVDALLTMGVCDSVTLRIRRGYYAQQIGITQAIPGSSVQNHVVFVSDEEDSASVVIDFKRGPQVEYSIYDDYVMYLAYASNLSFRNLSFRRWSTWGIHGVYADVAYINRCSNITIDQCNIVGTIECNNTNGFSFCNNALANGTLKVWNAQLQDNLKIVGNDFSNPGYYYYLVDVDESLPILSLYQQHNYTVSRNRVFGTSYTRPFLLLDSCAGGIVEGNKLQKQACHPDYNIVASVNIKRSFASVGNPILVHNNYVAIIPEHTVMTMLDVQNSSNIRFVHNTLASTGAKSSITIDNLCTNVNILNNILTPWPGNAFLGQAVCDYNLFNDTVLSISWLQNWQGLSGKDMHSQVGSVQFENSGIPNTYTSATAGPDAFPVHYDSAASAIYYTYNKLADVPTDIDGQARGNGFVNYGADEHVAGASYADLSIQLNEPYTDTLCMKLQQLSATVTNHTANILGHCVINWSMNGVLQQPYYYPNSINSNFDPLVVFGTYNFQSEGVYVLKAWLSYPDSTIDIVPTNDTILEQFYIGAYGSLTISQNGNVLTVPNSYSTYQWFMNGDTLFGSTSNSVIATEPQSVYSVTAVSTQGCTFQSNNVVYTGVGGNYNVAGIYVYPNPSSGSFVVMFNTNERKQLEVRNAIGDLLFKEYIEAQIHSLDLSNVLDGVYFLNVTQSGSNTCLRIVVER